MSTLLAYLAPLPWMLLLALLAWAVATLRRNVGLVDIFWSCFFVVVAAWHYSATPRPAMRATILLLLVLTWALRLGTYLAVRNWSAPEDHRYQAIRARNEPGFTGKSLYLVFGLQAVLAFVIAMPLAAALRSAAPLGALGLCGAVLFAAGFVFETVADAQLAAFRRDPANRQTVMDRGLWAYTRHPNYFGECCVWWGCFLLAADAGAAWTLFSPLLMTALLLRYSGVALLEQDIGERRPGYADYMARTNAFIPGPRRAG
jgi:steroid 5-alpha reductase family enzyme